MFYASLVLYRSDSFKRELVRVREKKGEALRSSEKRGRLTSKAGQHRERIRRVALSKKEQEGYAVLLLKTKTGSVSIVVSLLRQTSVGTLVQR